MPWQHTRPARAILATFATNPPPQRQRRDGWGSETLYVSTATDRRVADLRDMAEAEHARLLADYDAGRIGRDRMQAHRTEQEVCRDVVMRGRLAA